MKGIRAVCLFAAAVALSTTAAAAIVPKGSKYDPRIQYVMYNPDDVVVIRTRKGNSTLIQFEDGEYVVDVPTGGLAFGDPNAWTLGVRGNSLFLRPSGPFPNTNINIVTNRRAYAISLVETEHISQAAWQVRYKYPAKPLGKRASSVAEAKPAPCTDGPENRNYFKYGDLELSPSEAWDDGRFTCLRYPTSKALPAAYRYSPDSELKEALVNFHMNDDVMVIHETSAEFRLRLGSKVLGIKTDSLVDAPYNDKATTHHGRRVKRDGI